MVACILVAMRLSVRGVLVVQPTGNLWVNVATPNRQCAWAGGNGDGIYINSVLRGYKEYTECIDNAFQLGI